MDKDIKIVIIGAGAAGLMTAANILAPITVLERNEKAGKKLYITGKGRCNLTNDCGSDGVIKNVVRGQKFLLSALNRFSPSVVMEFFEGQGLRLVTERGGRVFPASNKASDVTKTLVGATEKNGSEIIFSADVTHIKWQGDGFELFLSDKGQDALGQGLQSKAAENHGGQGQKILADVVVLATGGKSYPSTGSDGSAFGILRALGHSVTGLYPSLVPLQFVSPAPILSGLTFKHVTAKVITKPAISADLEQFSAGEKQEIFEESGELLFTHRGVSGPVILTLSARAARKNPTALVIDFKPFVTRDELDKKLIALLSAGNTKAIKTLMTELVPKSLGDYIIESKGISPDKKAAEISKSERQAIVSGIKELRFDLSGTGGFGEAVITSGGGNLSEFNPSTMQSLLHQNLYVVGEMLDIDALTGGFNLQLAFATALAAAGSINKRFFGGGK